ncbi:hypothetical protein [uncultured Intestinimonas sp.]|uniref:hypothetical protein n=1 Tax=uncultured Intestinimonas sp. TaxID=1689265 RepID=UPI0025F9FDC4|nr:hypothetical protein [uncultured Intestinimonas sp.]
MSQHRQKRVMLPLLLTALVLLLAAFFLWNRPSHLNRILYQEGYTITGCTEQSLSVAIPKKLLPDGFPQEAEAFEASDNLNLLLWSDGSSNLYLDALCYANGRTPDLLWASFHFQYEPSSCGSLLLPYLPDGQGGSTQSLGLSSAEAEVDRSPWPDAVHIAGQGPGETFSVYLDAAAFQAASESFTFQVDDLWEVSYQPT